MERPPPLTFDIPDATVPGSEQSTTTTVRSGSVSVSGSALSGILRAGGTDVGVGYSRPGDVGSLSDTTFTHGGVGYEVERLLWWPNGTVRLDVYPDGLETAIGADAVLVVTPLGDLAAEYVWDVSDARYLGGGADFVWDSTFTPDVGSFYTAELRIGGPETPENVRLVGGAGSVPAEDAGVHQPAVDALRVRYEGIFDGTGCVDGDGGLCPAEPLQRWEMAVWLIRVLDQNEPAPPAQTRFDDIRDSPWWAAHTERLAAVGVTAGCATGPSLRYCPQQPVTRAQMATFLARAFDLPPGPVTGFVDVAATHTHAAGIDALAAVGVTAGCATGPSLRYCPQHPVTRAQMATFLARATGIIETPQPQPST